MVFAIGSIGSALVGKSAFLGTDLLSLVSPWNSTLEVTNSFTNTLLGDTFDSAVPQTALITESFRDGTLAQWNPYQSGGSELGGLPNSGAYSPISLPWWILPLSYAPGAVKLLEIVTIAVGMSLFLRRLRLPSASWAVASLVFASSGFMISWTNWPQTRVAAFIPLLFWALDRASVRRRIIDAIPVGVVLAAMLLGGFPAVVGYSLYAGAAYVIFRAVVDAHRFRAVLMACAVNALGLVIGFLLSAWQLIPFILNAMNLIDFGSRAQSPNIHLPWDSLATALVPGIVGTPGGSNYWGSRFNAIETFSYIGVAAIILILSTLVVRSRGDMVRAPAIFSGVALVVCGVLVFVGGIFLEVAQELPIFDSNPVLRLRVMIGFFAAILTAYGFANLLAVEPASGVLAEVKSRPVRLQWDFLARGLAVVLLTVTAVWLVRQTLYLAPAEKIDQARTETIVMFVVATIAVVLVAFAWLGRSRVFKTVVGVVMPILLVGPALVVTDLWWPKSEVDSFYPLTPTHEYLTENLGTQRFSSVGQTMFPGTNSYYKLRSLGGHNFHTSEWRDLLLELDENAFLSPTYSVLPAATISDTIADPLLDRLAVQYIVQDPNAALFGEVEAAEVESHVADLADGVALSSAVQQGPVRGIEFTLAEELAPGPDGVTMSVEVRDEDSGEVLATTSTWMKSAGGPRRVAIVGEDIPEAASWRAHLTISGLVNPARPLVTGDDELAIGLIRPDDDNLKIVHSGDATIFERQTALERVRWASESIVISEPAERVRALNSPATGPETVVLENAADDHPLPGDSSAVLVDKSRNDNEIRMDVSADGAGWVVVEDSLRRPGWTAWVDGVETTLVDAEHAGAAVFVEAGQHTVVVSYETPGRKAGLIVSGVAGLAVLASYAAVFFVRHRRRRLGR